MGGESRWDQQPFWETEVVRVTLTTERTSALFLICGE